MKRSNHDRKQFRRPALPVHTLAADQLREVRGGSSIIKPAQISAMDDWEAPVI